QEQRKLRRSRRDHQARLQRRAPVLVPRCAAPDPGRCAGRSVVAFACRYRGGHKLIAVTAVMRKLVRALWHVARGDVFDSSKLIDERALPARELDAATTPTPTSHDASATREPSVAL